MCSVTTIGLPALPQQIQSRGTVLGCAGKPLEWSPSVQRADGAGLVLQHDMERTQALSLAVRASLCQGRPVGKGGQASFRTEAQTLHDSPQMGHTHRTQSPGTLNSSACLI